MYTGTGEIQTSGQRDGPICRGCVGLSLLIVGLLAIAAWLILRQPEWRAALVGMVTHRTPTAFAAQRQILAPRSVALAGALFIMVGCGLILSKRSSEESGETNWVARFTQLFISMQGLVAVAVVINLFAFFLRTFGTPPCALDADSLFRYWVPQAYPHSLALMKEIGDEPKGIALRAEGGTFNRYLFSALIYPHRVYAADHVERKHLPSDPALNELRAKRTVDMFLYYDPYSTTQPLTLYRLEAP